jgi:hypothetical protein
MRRNLSLMVFTQLESEFRLGFQACVRCHENHRPGSFASGMTLLGCAACGIPTSSFFELLCTFKIGFGFLYLLKRNF